MKYKIAVKQPNPATISDFVDFGSYYLIDGSVYVLSVVTPTEFALINLHSGNRYKNPASFIHRQVSREELALYANGAVVSPLTDDVTITLVK